jgi:PAS domain S-box-containing protein
MRDQDKRQQETMGAGRTEGAAQEEPGLLSAIVEGTPDAVFVKDLDGRYLLVNSACTRILGRPKEEIVGRDDAQILPPETAGRLAEVDRVVINTGEASSYEEVLPVGGRPRTYLSTKSVYRDAAGNALGIIGISRDITERKEAERTQRFLAEAGALLSSSLDYGQRSPASLAWRYRPWPTGAASTCSRRTAPSRGWRWRTRTRGRFPSPWNCRRVTPPTPKPQAASTTFSGPAAPSSTPR